MILWALILALSSFSSTPKLNDLRNGIAEESAKIQLLSAEVTQLDKSLKTIQTKLAMTREQEGGLSSLIEEVKDKLGLMESKHAAQTSRLRFLGLKVAMIRKDEGVASQLAAKLLERDLNIEKNQLKTILDPIQKANIQLQKMRLRLGHIRSNHKAKLTKLESLEAKRIDVLKRYQDRVSYRQELEKLLAKELYGRKNKQVTAGSKGIPYLGPLVQTQFQLKKTTSGVKVLFNGQHPLLAPVDGEVEYVGPLANYGKVVMIRVRGDIRVVILGMFRPSVKEKQRVQRGRVIGLKVQSTEQVPLYVEIRKRNVVQSAFGHMAKSSI